MPTFRAVTPRSLLKASRELGIVFGFAIVSKVKGERYFDLQGDHIPDDALTKAASDFMSEFRTGKEMHVGGIAADVPFLFPLTEDIAKALDIKTEKHGLLIGFKPRDPAVLEKFIKGEYTGFSIGGDRGEDEPVEDDEEDAA